MAEGLAPATYLKVDRAEAERVGRIQEESTRLVNNPFAPGAIRTQSY